MKSKDWDDMLAASFERGKAAGRAEGIEAAAKVCAGYGREGDRLSKEYACETADELEARILALLKVPESSPAGVIPCPDCAETGRAK